MYLTRHTDMGLRLLMYLASEKRELPVVTVAEVSTQFNIPRNHLVKVAGQLAKEGWIIAVRGRSGGLRLAVAPELIKIGRVVSVLEGRKELIECEQLGCRLSMACGLRNALNKGLAAFYATLDGFTLADIIGGNTGEQVSAMHGEFLRFFAKESSAKESAE
ncbi:MAG: Rrf2 family transcriptional regulator [Pseudomonadota bacterium]